MDCELVLTHFTGFRPFLSCLSKWSMPPREKSLYCVLLLHELVFVVFEITEWRGLVRGIFNYHGSKTSW